MKNLLLALLIIICTSVSAQTKFKIKEVVGKDWKSTFYIVNEKGKVIKQLDTTKYLMRMSPEQYGYFAVFALKNKKGWQAIDFNEKILFEEYNWSPGEPTPDGLIENRIRIIDKDGKIGFADEKGNIIIRPQFEIASSFYQGKAMIGKECKKIPWGNHENEEGGCNHYSINCNQNGYINIKGEIIELGDFTFEAIQKKIGWKSPY
jgi:hypothetical protein